MDSSEPASSASWLKITTKKSGKGTGTVKYSVSANPATSQRTGSIAVADQTFTVTQEEAKPKISTPSNVAFGKIKSKNKTAQKTVSVKNAGQASLVIGTIDIADDNGVFSVTKDNCSGKTLPKAKTCTMRLKFSSQTAGSYEGSLTIPSNDPDTSAAIVPLSGSI